MSKNLKLKKVIKSFVPEPISRVFGFQYVYEHLWTFSVSVWICLFHVLLFWSYFWTCICYSIKSSWLHLNFYCSFSISFIVYDCSYNKSETLFIVFSRPFFQRLYSCLWRCLCLWTKNNQHSSDAVGTPMLALRGVPNTHDTRTCCLCSTSVYVGCLS